MIRSEIYLKASVQIRGIWRTEHRISMCIHWCEIYSWEMDDFNYEGKQGRNVSALSASSIDDAVTALNRSEDTSILCTLRVALCTSHTHRAIWVSRITDCALCSDAGSGKFCAWSGNFFFHLAQKKNLSNLDVFSCIFSIHFNSVRVKV